jgi:hypothetical protein
MWAECFLATLPAYQGLPSVFWREIPFVKEVEGGASVQVHQRMVGDFLRIRLSRRAGRWGIGASRSPVLKARSGAPSDLAKDRNCPLS